MRKWLANQQDSYIKANFLQKLTVGIMLKKRRKQFEKPRYHQKSIKQLDTQEHFHKRYYIKEATSTSIEIVRAWNFALQNTFTIAHYKSQLHRPNLDICLSVTSNNLVSHNESWSFKHKNTHTNENIIKQ